MFGWLKRKADRLQFERIQKKLWEAFGVSQDLREENDNGAFLSIKVEDQMPPLSGFEEDVRVVRSSAGIVLIKESDGTPVSASLAPSQENLQRIPIETDEVAFAYLIVKSEYVGLDDRIYSCVVERGGQHYGDARAFWWSLAKKEVYWKSKAINLTRMTKKSLSQVVAVAKGTWDAAVEHYGSIHNMRDLLVPLRLVDLGVLNKIKDHYDSKSAKFGVDIARAMILATQSEDPKLEAVAFERFKQFIWQPGDEPEEFSQSAHPVNVDRPVYVDRTPSPSPPQPVPQPWVSPINWQLAVLTVGPLALIFGLGYWLR